MTLRHKLTTLVATGFLLAPALASAHVVVTPNEAGIGDSVLFSMSVPNERQSAVTSIKLMVPSGLDDVQPDVMAGWDITTTTSGSDTTAIVWTGTIPVGQRADLTFKAQVPSKAGELDWKAYQTYADGTVVSWDERPTPNMADDDAATTGPYSITKVVNDLGNTATSSVSSNNVTLAFTLSIVAIALSLIGLFIRLRS